MSGEYNLDLFALGKQCEVQPKTKKNQRTMKFNAPLRVYGFGMVLRQGTWPVGNQKSGFYEFTFFLLHLDISLFYFIWFVTIGKDGHSRAEYTRIVDILTVTFLPRSPQDMQCRIDL